MKQGGLNRLLSQADMSVTQTSMALTFDFTDNISFQFNWTGTPTGTFYVDGSIDGATWNAVPLSPTPTAGGADGSALVNVAQLSCNYVRCRYVPTSGSGALDAFSFMKSLGS